MLIISGSVYRMVKKASRIVISGAVYKPAKKYIWVVAGAGTAKVESGKIVAPPILWYEDENGNKIDHQEDEIETPQNAFYQASQFPNTLATNYLKLVRPEEVAACPHLEEHVHPTDGWIDGVEGRECKQCNGTQTKNVDEPWPDQWEAYGSRQFLSMNAGWSEDLALAMANNGYKLGDAILITALCCERCLNVLLDYYDTGDGYLLGSEEEKKCGTSCDFCDAVTEFVQL